MNSSYTPVHIRLWNSGFWAMAFANLLLSASVFMLLPLMPGLIERHFGLSSSQVALFVAMHGIGVYLFGPLCSMLVQRYRRNIVCALSILFSSLTFFLLFYLCKTNYVLCTSSDTFFVFIFLLLIQLIGSAFYGLSQMVLSGTLTIDVCESYQRTEANHSAAWFGRLGFALGPIAAILISSRFSDEYVILSSSVCGIIAMLLVLITKFPFRAPDENIKVFSTDRFILTNGTWLFVNFVMAIVAVGMVVVNQADVKFFMLMLGGFLISLIAQKIVLANTEFKGEILSALVFIMVAILIIIFHKHEVSILVSALLMGIGIGVSATRFLLYFIKLSPHCKRCTSLSTFFLAWQSGLAIGISIGILTGDTVEGYSISLILVISAMLMYHFFTHSWFLNNKIR